MPKETPETPLAKIHFNVTDKIVIPNTYGTGVSYSLGVTRDVVDTGDEDELKSHINDLIVLVEDVVAEERSRVLESFQGAFSSTFS